MKFIIPVVVKGVKDISVVKSLETSSFIEIDGNNSRILSSLSLKDIESGYRNIDSLFSVTLSSLYTLVKRKIFVICCDDIVLILREFDVYRIECVFMVDNRLVSIIVDHEDIFYYIEYDSVNNICIPCFCKNNRELRWGSCDKFSYGFNFKCMERYEKINEMLRGNI